ILRRGNAVRGVTTAATLWVMTVIGLCFGGGQLVLGGVTTAIVALVLSVMKRLDLRLPRERRARLTVTASNGEGLLEAIRRALDAAQLEGTYRSGTYEGSGQAELHYLVTWRGAAMLAEPTRTLAPL